MRIGINLPRRDRNGQYLDAKQIAARAKLIEDAGIDGIWGGEHIPLPGDLARDSPDTLAYLAVAATATDRIELGTCIYCLPLHNPYAAAQRFSTLQALAPGGRWTFGIGTSSQQKEYEAIGLEWDDRFKRMRSHMRAVHAIYAGGFDGQRTQDVDLFPTAHWNTGFDGSTTIVKNDRTMAMEMGKPRFVLGAWASEIQLKRAATEYDGWMTSAGPGTARGGWKKVFSDGITRYRDLGGTRAMISTMLVDLKMPTTPMPDDGGFILACDLETAQERLHVLAEMGYDDVIIKPVDYQADGNTMQVFDYTKEDLEMYRALVPEDPRTPAVA